MTAPSRRLAGARAQGNGAAFEEWLADYVSRPLVTRAKLLRFDRLNPDTRSVWDSVRRCAVFKPVAKSGADFVLMLPGGRYGVCELKSTSETRFYRVDIPPHQVAHLDLAVAAGGAAYLAVQFRNGPTSTAYLLPWARIPWAVARTSQSVVAADLAPFAVRGWIDAARIIGAAL